MTEDTLTPTADEAVLAPTDTTATTDPTSSEAAPDAEAAADIGATFEDMNLEAPISQALEEMGYAAPMEVQSAVYHHILAGKDVMVQARTGTGKTAAFGIPIAQKLKAEIKGVQALVLAPTRELALQVATELGKITQHQNLSVVPIYGGAPIGPQTAALEAGAQIVCGTPGRVLDHIRRRTLKTSGVKLLVLDECDEMLSMGFQEEIENIVSTLPPAGERQTMLFSATIPPDIERIARRHMRDPEEIALSSDDDISGNLIDHSYFVVSGMARTRDLLKVMEVERPESAIIFCNTREDTNTVSQYLRRHGYDAEALSSDLSQRDRERVMKRARDKTLNFLVATDVAARGIDINDLSHVINYAFPESPEVYVHRTGRTGRAGKQGTAISLVGPREIGSFYYLKLLYKIRPVERDLPSASEIATIREGKRYLEVVAKVPAEPKSEYKSLARRLWASEEGERVVGALLQELLEPKKAPKRAVAEPASDAPAPAAEADAPANDDDTSSRPPRRTRGRRDESRGATSSEERPRRRRRARGGEGAEGEERPRRRRLSRRDGESTTSETRDASPEGAPVDAEAKPVAAEPVAVETKPVAAEPVAVETKPVAAETKPVEAETKPVETEAAEAKAPSKPPARAKSEDGDGPKRKRRRRRTNKASDTPAADEGTPKEFWEAWADEKTNADEKTTRTPAVAAFDNGEPDNTVELQAHKDTTRLYINIGRREEVTADELRDLLSEGLGDDAERLGKVQVRNTHSYIRVPDEMADNVIENTVGKSYKEREVVVERAKR